MQRILLSISLLFLAACGGGGSGGNTQALATATMMNMQSTSTNGGVILKAPVLSFNDSGFSVSDGITRFGRWAVESEIEWEFSLNQGASWTRGVGASFEVTGDGAKMIWVRARDDAGNTSVGRHLGIESAGTIVHAGDDHLVVTLGLKDILVVHTPDATLVADRGHEEGVRKVVAELEKRGWTEYL